jgi:hypothetical protein
MSEWSRQSGSNCCKYYYIHSYFKRKISILCWNSNSDTREWSVEDQQFRSIWFLMATEKEVGKKKAVTSGAREADLHC